MLAVGSCETRSPQKKNASFLDSLVHTAAAGVTVGRAPKPCIGGATWLPGGPPHGTHPDVGEWQINWLHRPTAPCPASVSKSFPVTLTLRREPGQGQTGHQPQGDAVCLFSLVMTIPISRKILLFMWLVKK